MTTHSTRVIRAHPTEEQARAFTGTLLCRHCVHPAPEGGELRGIPLSGPYQPRRGAEAQFCSTSCMLAFTLERPSYRSQMQRAAIIRVHFDETGEHAALPAPPQSMLDVFGGPWDVATFRAQAGARRLVRRCEAPFASQMTMAVAEIYQTDATAAGPAPEPMPTQPAPAPPVDEDAGPTVLSQLNEWGLTNLRRPEAEPPELMEVEAAPDTSVYEDYLGRVGVGAPAEDVARSPAPARPTNTLAATPAAPVASERGGGLTRYLKRK